MDSAMLEKVKVFISALWKAANTVSGFWFWGWLGGRTFVFVMCSLGAMVWLEYLGKLESQLVAGLGVLAGLFTGRAVLDDYVQYKQRTISGDPSSKA